MSEKHTPGPWHVLEEPIAPFAIDLQTSKSRMQIHTLRRWVESSTERIICKMCPDGHDPNGDPRDRATADLIAAAPQLLSALKNLTQQFDITSGDCEPIQFHGSVEHVRTVQRKVMKFLEEAESAIAAATGSADQPTADENDAPHDDAGEREQLQQDP